MRLLTSLGEAVRFLTVVPVPTRADLGPDLASRGTTAWFPLVGLLIGVVLYGVMALPVPAVPRAALTLVLWVGLTGGLHEDGFIDSLEAAVAPVNPDDRRRILKDPHIGAQGVTGALLFQLTRFALLTAAPAVALLTAPVLGRWAMTASLAFARPGDIGGLGVALRPDARPVAATLITGFLLAALTGLTALAPGRVVVAWAFAAAAGAAWGRFLSRRLGGLTGDGHGAVGIVAELAALAAFVPMASCGT